MKDKKNIDRLFQEKFKDFEVTPDPAIWEKIKARQTQKKKRVFLLPLWYRAAGVAALLAILFTVGYLAMGTNDIPSEKIVLENDQNIPDTSSPKVDPAGFNDQKTEVSTHNQTHQETKDFVSKHQENKRFVYNTKNNDTPQKSNQNHVSTAEKKRQKPAIIDPSDISKQNQSAIGYATTHKNENTDSSGSPLQNPDVVTNTPTAKNPKNTLPQDYKNAIVKQPGETNELADQQIAKNRTVNKNIANPEKNTTSGGNSEKEEDKTSIFDAIAQKEDPKENTIEEDADKKWNVSPNIAPVYYSSIGNGSSIDPQFADNSKGGEVNMSYGIQIAYTVNKRLSVRSGVHKLDLSYNTKSIGFSPSTIVSQNLRSVNYDANADVIAISDISPPKPVLNADNTNGFDVTREAINRTQNEGILNQRIDYIEIPLEMKYVFIEKKIGVHMIGGLSTLFLQGNEISIEAGNFETNIGQANNINKVSFTGNVGIGVDYSISKQFLINVEPILKYQLNGFEGNAQNFRPFYFGVYTGVSVKF